MDIIAICSPLHHPETPLPGSVVRPCEDCGVPCVLSPSSVARDPRWVLCHACGLPLLDARPDLMLAPTPEALQDYLELQRRRRAGQGK